MYGSPKTQQTLLQKARSYDRAFFMGVESYASHCARVEISVAD